MKNIRKLLLIVLAVLILSGCNVSSNQGDVETSKNEKISLNLHNLDLIANITDNEKYLNKDLVKDLNILEDSDKVSIIITLDDDGLTKIFTDDNSGYTTVKDYAASSYGAYLVKKMERKQKEVAEILLSGEYINTVNHSYSTLFNGFSADTTYGQYKKLLEADLGYRVTMSEVYAQPITETKSESGKNTVTNIVNVYETGIFDSSQSGYDGTKTAVSILDSGFDIHHTVFQNMPEEILIDRSDVEAVINQTRAYSYHKNIKVQDVYMNDKIPFVYDYADKDPDVAPYDSNHGTHVGGIIGGKDDKITGVAINTQLVLMKVFGDINNGAETEDILAALEDSILLGVDAINMSLGLSCGFASSSDDEYINVVYERIEDAGISVVVAASNDYSSGYGGEDSNTNKASNPDSATVGSPGSYPSTISVASISGVKSEYIVDEDGHTFFFNNANNLAGKSYDFYDMLYEANGNPSGELLIEYVTVPGVGKKVNYASIDVKGKIALVKRGDTTFEEKAQVALDQGAIGCIIYNNIAGDILMNAGSELKIALASISKDDGEVLAAKGSGILSFNRNNLAGPFMSNFSSWGPVSNLTLKPEITAHGGSITSSVPGGGYDSISGTSMACPNLCGVIILVRQYLKEKYPDITSVELTNLTNQLLMSTSTIVLDEYGNPYSPRKQGSGLGNLDYAIKSNAYLSVDGSTKTKLELWDDPNESGVYTLKFKVNNISNSPLQYKLTDFTMTESISTSDPKYVSEQAYMLNPQTEAAVSGDGSLEKDVITVNANGTLEITYKLTLNDIEKKYLRESFINGIYVEGFAVLESLNEDKIDLSIPFLAFFGDWTKAPMFDKTYYEVESEAHNGAIDEEDKIKADYYASTPLGTYYHSYIIPLGSYVYEMDEDKYDPIPATEEHAAIGYNLETINGITAVYAGLLRNAKKVTTTIVNADTGAQVYEHVKYDQHKAYFNGAILPSYDLLNLTAVDLGLQNNTKYTFTMEAELDYGDGGKANNLNNKFEFSFYVDYEVPTITNVEYYTKYDKGEKEYRYFVDVYVYDNHYAQSIRPFTVIGEQNISLSEQPIPIYGEKGEINKVTIEITDYMDLLQYSNLQVEGEEAFPLTNGLGFLVDDYALNQAYTFVTFPGTNSGNLAYDSEYSTGKPDGNGVYTYFKMANVGDVIDLFNGLTSDDPTLMATNPEVQGRFFKTLHWTSSDESILKVKNGQVEVVGSGSAIITCEGLGSNGYKNSCKIKINVRTPRDISETRRAADTTNKLTNIEFTHFDTLFAFLPGPEFSEIGETGDRTVFTDKSTISFYPSEKVQLGFEIEPWNLKNYELIWKSSNEKVATVDENGVVTAIKEGSANITLSVKVDGKVSSLRASTRVVVKNEFIIEGNVLVAYKGAGGDVVIPDDEGILYIGAYAFSLYETDYEIEVTEDDYDAAKAPGSNNTITSVTIPHDVMEVRKHAFYNCDALETVTFLSKEDNEGDIDSCPIIQQYAFYSNDNLKNINMENVEVVGASAFEDCVNLNNIDLSSIYAIGAFGFKGCTSLEYVDLTTLRNGGIEAFANCTKLTTIDNGVYTNFAKGMFKNSGLTSLTFNADRIPDNCFENCERLNDITITRDIVYVGARSFKDCENLKTVTFTNGSGSEFIYEYAFDNCIKLETVILPDSSFTVEEGAFNNCTKLSMVSFGKNSVITNNHGAIFSGCGNLSSFDLNAENINYSVSGSLLLSKDGTEIILAAPNFDYNNYQVPTTIVKIGEGAFSGINKLTSLTIPANVTEIKASAFQNCEELLTLTMLGQNTEILDKAFMGCVKLNSVNFDNIKTFNPYVFANTGFTTLNLNDVLINEGAFSNIDTLTEINITTTSNIGAYAFYSSDNLLTANIDALGLGDYAFTSSPKLNALTLSNVITIGEGVFGGCSELSAVSSSTLEAIGDFAFSDCVKLSTLALSNIKTIGNFAFSSVDALLQNTVTSGNSLVNLDFPDTLVSIGNHAFYASNKLETVTVGNGLKTIGEYAFGNTLKLQSFVTTGNVEVIEMATFYKDDLLKEPSLLHTVTIPGVKQIKDAAFYNASSLVNINLENVEEFGVQSFYNCQGLTELNLLKARVIGDGAFFGSTNIITLNIPIVETIGILGLSGIGVESISLPNTVNSISPMAFCDNLNQKSFTDVNGNSTVKINDYILLDNGVLYTTLPNGRLNLSSYPTAKTDRNYEVKFGTARIEEYAGYNNQYIAKLIFPETLKMIGNLCFYNSKKLSTIEFKSTQAPILEGTVDKQDLGYTDNCDVMKFLNKYLQFNGYYPLYYGQFNDYVGRGEKLKIILPKNEDLEGYDRVLYDLYFDLSNKTISDYIALNAKSVDYINKIVLVPNVDEVTLRDEAVIKNARAAYNLLNQNLNDFPQLLELGYDQNFFAIQEQNLTACEEKWLDLKMERINTTYQYLISDISALGSKYDFNKISDYYKILKKLDIISDEDKKYIDTTNVDSFKTGFNDYFNDLNEDTQVIGTISTLPTNTVNKVGLEIATVTAATVFIGLIGLIIKKYWF